LEASFAPSKSRQLVWNVPNFKEESVIKKTLVPMLAVAAMLSFALTILASQEPRPEARQEDAPQLVSATIKQVDTAGSTVMVETPENSYCQEFSPSF
jgi:hypothetical protein